MVEYDVEVGGKDGNSFSLFGDTWKNGKSTPGKENIFQEVKKEEEKESGDSGSDDEAKIDRTYVEISDMIDGKKKLKAEIIDNIPVLIAGAENEFNGRAYGITGIEIRGAEYFWTLGDGKKEYGKSIKHTFLYPGEYVLTLIVKSANFTGNTRKIVKVVDPDIEILEVDSKKNWIKLRNNYFDILKLDGWFLFVDGEKFKIPKETYILGKKEIIFPNQITHLDVRKNSNIYLLFPNGQKVTKFVKKSEVVLKNFSLGEVSSEDKKEIKMFLGEKNDKKKIYKSKKTLKKNVEKKVVKNSGNDYFYRNNFNKQKEKDLEVEFNDSEREGDFAKQNFLPKNIEKTQKLILEKEDNFWMENVYFIGFIFLTGSLVLISFLINYFEQKNKKSDELNSFASEFEIEEI